MINMGGHTPSPDVQSFLDHHGRGEAPAGPPACLPTPVSDGVGGQAADGERRADGLGGQAAAADGERRADRVDPAAGTRVAVVRERPAMGNDRVARPAESGRSNGSGAVNGMAGVSFSSGTY